MKTNEALARLVGQTVETVTDCVDGSDDVTITMTNGDVLRLYHDQDCCERVGLVGRTNSLQRGEHPSEQQIQPGPGNGVERSGRDVEQVPRPHPLGMYEM